MKAFRKGSQKLQVSTLHGTLTVHVSEYVWMSVWTLWHCNGVWIVRRYSSREDTVVDVTIEVSGSTQVHVLLTK